MRTFISMCLISFTLAVVATFVIARAEGQQEAEVVVPETTVEHPEDIGKRAHTNHLIRRQAERLSSAPSGETPASLRPVYSLPSAGGSGVIAVVDAFDYPSAENDFDVFSKQFGLPLSSDNSCNGGKPCFQKVFATGTRPSVNCGWAQESALDIEWAHAMAPSAQIVLVEAASNGFFDLLQAVDVASGIVAGGGGGEVAMSWGGSEFSLETQFDSHFIASGVVYLAASGDSGGKTIYPSASPEVVAAGGTTINRDTAGNFISETAWSGSGGGRSKYEPRPAYQDFIVSLVGSHRGTPDFSFDANPVSGVSVFDSTPCNGASGWLVFGGTSVSAPSLAGIINLAGHFYANTGIELSTIYSDLMSPRYALDFRDIVSGRAGRFRAKAGWDFTTGVGTNQSLVGK